MGIICDECSGAGGDAGHGIVARNQTRLRLAREQVERRQEEVDAKGRMSFEGYPNERVSGVVDI